MSKVIRLIRVLCVILFVASIGLYIVTTLQYRNNTNIIGPTISMADTTVTVSIHDDLSAILDGVTAADSSGRNVSDLLIVESLSSFVSPSVREASIAAFDADGNVAKATRTVVYSDYTAPQVSLSAPLSVASNNTFALLSRITITDCLDGDISDQLLLSTDGAGISTVTGEYAMRIEVTNSAGDSLSVPVTVELYNAGDERSRPKIGLSEYLIYVKQGQQVAPEAYLQTLSLNGQDYTFDSEHRSFVPTGKTYNQLVAAGNQTLILPFSTVAITNPAAFDTPGVYEITYRCTNEDDITAAVRLVVIVEEQEG